MPLIKKTATTRLRAIVRNHPKAFFCAAIFFLSTNFSVAATVTIGASETKSANNDFTNGDIANFTGSGTLNVDGSRTLATITTAAANTGNISFSTINTLTVSGTGNIGASNFSLRNIDFQNDGTLSFGGNLFVGAQGITTTSANQGNLTLTGTNQIISPNIGAANLRLNTINLNSNATFNGAVYANQLTTSTDGSTINGTGLLNFSISNFTNSTALSSTDTISLGTTVIGSSKTLTINSDANIIGLTSGNATSTISIASGKNLTFSSNITGMGIIKGATSGVGDISFIGNAAQVVASSYQIGDSSNRIGKLTINNPASVSFANDAYVSSIAFTQSNDSSTLSIASTKTLDISGDVSTSFGGIIRGAGSVTLSGSSTQTIAASLGTSRSDRLNTLLINNSATSTTNVSLNKAYLTNLNIGTSDTSILVNDTLDVNNFNATQNISLGGNGSISLAALTVSNDKTVTFNSDASIGDLDLGNANSTIGIAAGKTLTFSGDLTYLNASGKIQGINSGNAGNIAFTGAAEQGVDIQIGVGPSDRIGKVSISNIAGVNFFDNSYISSLAFTQSSGSSTLTIDNTKTLDISGDISTTNTSATGIIDGQGSVRLSGAAKQTANTSFGTSTGNRLGALIIDNSTGAALIRDNYLTSLTITNGELSIGGDATTDITNSINLNSKTISFGTGKNANPFGKIKSGSVIFIDNNTGINLDYSTLKSRVPLNSQNSYNIAESGSGISVISGTINDVKVSDNSYLFNTSLAIIGNNITASITPDQTNFSRANFSNQTYDLITNAANYSDLSSGLVSVSSSDELLKAIETMKPLNNASSISSVLNSNSNLLKTTELRGVEPLSRNNFYQKNIWGNFFGSNLVQKKREKAVGYKEKNGGLVFGFEEASTKNSVFGAAFSYSRSQINADLKTTHEVQIDNYQLAFYNNNFSRNKTSKWSSKQNNRDARFIQSRFGFYNNNSFALAFNRYKTNRKIEVGSFSRKSQGSFNGNSASARTGIGYKIQATENIFIDPNFAFELFTLDQNSYQEKGAGNAGLSVKSSRLNGYFTDLGVNFSTLLSYKEYDFRPKLKLNWRKSGGEIRQKSKIAFLGGGAEIENNSIFLQKNQFETGLGLDFDNGKSSFFQIQLDGKFADGMIGSGLSGRYIYLF